MDNRPRARYHRAMPKLYCYQQFRTFPYFKVQWYDARALCWRDVQAAHATEAEARAAFIAGKQCRIMVIEEKGRHPMASSSPAMSAT